MTQDIDYLLYIEDNLVKKTDFYRKNKDAGTPDSISYIQTVDKTILLIPTLIQAKSDIQTALTDLNNKLNSIKGTRDLLDANLTDMENIINGTYSDKNSKTLPSSSSRYAISAALILMTLLA